MTVHWTVVREAVVIIWVVCCLVIALGQDFCIWPSTTPFVYIPITTQSVDGAVTLGASMHPFVIPFGLLGGWRFEAGDFMRHCCVWEGRLRCLTSGFGIDYHFPNHLCHLPYFLQWSRGLGLACPSMLISTWRHIHGWRLFTNKTWRSGSLLSLVHSCPDSKHA